jgi:exosortase A
LFGLVPVSIGLAEVDNMSLELDRKIPTNRLDPYLNIFQVLFNFAKDKWYLVVALLVQSYFFSSAWKAFYRTWTSQDFSYGMAIVPISLFLVWRMRGRLFGQPSETSKLPLLGVALGAAIWFSGHITATASVMQFGVVVAGIFTVLSLVGLQIGRIIWFPLFFVLMILPFGGWLTPYLTDWTADAVHVGLRSMGIPVFREGEEFVLPTGRWSVISACSGLRFVLSAVVLSCLFAHLNFRKLKTSVTFVALTVLVSILANWIRAILTVLTGHITHMKYGPGEEHLWFGWVIFGMAMWATFWFAARWRDTDDTEAQLVTQRSAPFAFNTASAGILVAVVFIAGVFNVAAKSLVVPASDALVSSFSSQSVAATTAVEKVVYEPPLVGASSMVKGANSNDQSQFLIALFAGQANSVSMLSLANQLTPDDEKADWKMRDLQTRAVADLGFSVREFVVVSARSSYRVQYWYTVAGVHTASPVKAKILTLQNVLKGRGDTSILNLIVHKNIEVNAKVDSHDQVLLKSIAANSSAFTLNRR